MELFAKIVNDLTLSWRRQLSYRNQSIDLLCKSIDWLLYITAFVMKDLKSIDLTQVLMSFGAEDIFKNVSSLIYYNLSLRHRFGSLWREVRKKQKTEYLKSRTWLFYKKNSQPVPQIVKLRNTFWRVFIRDHSFSTYAKFSKKIK